jgi:large subunit ribosomal protein L21
MYALVSINGRQYKAEKGARLKVDLLSRPKGDLMEFDSVLLTSDGGTVRIGTPYVSGATVKAVVEEEGRDRKIVVYKYRRRKGFHKKRGHRQSFSVLRVEDITVA